jgi:predicted GNAT superfamily acetyltransferase
MEIKELKSFADLKSVEHLQRVVWGAADIDILAPLSLRATVEAGNLLLGAFDGSTMVGFVYGFLGFLDGQVELHSDMAGLLPEYRDRGVGYQMKLAQREWALARGIRLVTWTFDPLRSRNAHFNFHKLGATSDSYRVNFYGEDSTSFLHRNSTDRLWMSWELDSPRVRDRIAGLKPPAIDAPRIVSVGANAEPVRHAIDDGVRQVAIAIPVDPDAVGLELAVRWRETTRGVFLEWIRSGYRVTEFDHGVYILSRG